MPQPLRVMTFLHSFEPGGVERVALRLVARWRRNGFCAPLVLGRSDGAMWAEWPGLDYRSLAWRGLATAWFETLWMIVRLPGAIRRERPDILFCAGNTYTIVAVAMKLLLGKTCPPIVAKISNDLARHDLIGPARWAYTLWLRIQGRAIDHFIGMAPPMANEIARAMRIPSDRITIIHDPAISKADITAPPGTPSRREGDHNGTYFVAVGRLAPQKNFKLLIEAFARIADRADRLTILGEGPERNALERLAARLGVGTHLSMPGHVGLVSDHLPDHDVFVLSSNYEGVPAVIIEALAAGLPIVATDCSVSMTDLLDNGALGELVPVRSRWSLAEAMRVARKCRPDPIAAGRKAEQFTIETAADRYANIFGQVASRRDTALRSHIDSAARQGCE